jgi:hypothetical protein
MCAISFLIDFWSSKITSYVSKEASKISSYIKERTQDCPRLQNEVYEEVPYVRH